MAVSASHTAAVGDAVRSAIAGTKASALRDGEDEHDIVVQLAPEYRDDLQSVLGLRLPGREDRSPDTFPVPISTVASYELVGGSGAIQHVDQDLVVTITGDVLYGFNENEVRADVQALLDGLEPRPGMSLSTGGADEQQQESAEFLVRAFAIAVALILMVLVTQFDSLSMPLIIIFTVTLSLTGVLWGLLLTGTPFGVIMTGLGVIATVLRFAGFPLAPLLIGFILGPMMENNFARAANIADGVSFMWERPMTLGLLILAALLILLPSWRARRMAATKA